jgi:hypothetical protein
MALTVEVMSRLTTYVMADSTVEQFIKDGKITGEDVDAAKEYWTEMEKAKADLKPGEQIMIPSDWS